MRDVDFYLDFISPYSWLALVRAGDFARQHQLRWVLTPVVYGVLLDRTGLVGPVETEAKRRYTIRDAARTAAAFGRRLVGPPAHPFRSLEALRTVCLYGDDPRVLELAAAIADAAWQAGRDISDLSVLEDVLQAQGFDGSELGPRLQAEPVKQQLRSNTQAALENGVFGVPTFRYEGELFWGQDRMDSLAARLAGTAPDVDVEAFLSRPAAAVRKRAPQP